MLEPEIVVIAHNMRSTHNVGALLRTCDGIGVHKVYLTGYTPYPIQENDPRLPHIARRTDAQIHKTALGAEKSIMWTYSPDIEHILNTLSIDGYEVVALEQSSKSIPLPEYRPPKKVAILLGEEVHGVDSSLLKLIDIHLEIPMLGKKESHNVVQALSMSLYHVRFVKV